MCQECISDSLFAYSKICLVTLIDDADVDDVLNNTFNLRLNSDNGIALQLNLGKWNPGKMELLLSGTIFAGSLALL